MGESNKSELFMGLMSGTSLDGVDAVLVDFKPSGGGVLNVVEHAFEPFGSTLRAELLALNSSGGRDELQRAALASNALARCYALVVDSLLEACSVSRDEVVAVGVHGQTVRHRPGEFDGTGFTVQLNNPALVAELCGIDVVSDFRSRDVAAGGQGAPLVPAFHRAVFGEPGRDTAVLNLGGIANLTLLRADGSTGGFDCGPANALMDHWAAAHLNQPFDLGGAWAATGRVDTTLLSSLLAEPYFALHPPKSTGRDLFNAAWLAGKLQAVGGRAAPRPQDVQATLTELTARAATDALLLHMPEVGELLVCGGGALNTSLMQRLRALLPRVGVRPTDDRSLPAMHVEAAAFAWLARAFMLKQPGNLTAVTGARGPRILGALYPR